MKALIGAPKMVGKMLSRRLKSVNVLKWKFDYKRQWVQLTEIAEWAKFNVKPRRDSL